MEVTDLLDEDDVSGYPTAGDLAEALLSNLTDELEGDKDETLVEENWPGGNDVTVGDVLEQVEFQIDGRPSVRFKSASNPKGPLQSGLGGARFAETEEIEVRKGETEYRAVCGGCGGEGRITVTHGWNNFFECPNCETVSRKGG